MQAANEEESRKMNDPWLTTLNVELVSSEDEKATIATANIKANTTIAALVVLLSLNSLRVLVFCSAPLGRDCTRCI